MDVRCCESPTALSAGEGKWKPAEGIGWETDPVSWLSRMIWAAKMRNTEVKKNEIWFWVSFLRDGDQPDNEAASSEGKGRAQDMVSCSLAARDMLALNTVGNSLVWPSLWMSLEGGLAHCALLQLLPAAPAAHEQAEQQLWCCCAKGLRN